MAAGQAGAGTSMSVVRATNLTKTYRSGDVEVQAVRGVDFVIEPGSFVAFVGPSGSGKSTLDRKSTRLHSSQ